MSRRQLEEHREIWERKPVLAEVYAVWFDALLATMPGAARILEVGAGPGFLAHHARTRRPDLRWVSSDVVETPWNDLAADALRLPVRDSSLDGVLALDLLHHLARPMLFFREVARVLRPGGRLASVEPWVSPFSYPIYRWLHQEGCRLGLDPWDPFGVAATPDKEPLRGDNACASLLLRCTPPGRWRELGFATPRVQLFGGFAYLLSLGFRRASLLPARLAGPAIGLDRLLARLGPLIALRGLLSWERSSFTPAARG